MVFLPQNSPSLEKLLSDFYVLTNMKICVFDFNGNELCYYPKRYCHFCECVVKNPDLYKLCQQDDLRARAECTQTKKEKIYTCHAGLTECIAPIVINNEISGYIMIGQIRTKENHSVPKELIPDEIRERYLKMPLIPYETIKSALHIVQICAEHEQLKAYLKESSMSFSSLFSFYVASHIEEEISIERLMIDFHLSRSDLYRKVKENFRVSPAQYIREQRLITAKNYLEKTDLRISDIAKKCGFSDYNYFYRMLKKRFDKSGKELRKF